MGGGVAPGIDHPARPGGEPVGLRLICGDCLDVLPCLEQGSVDVIVTSPPYNLDLAYGSYQDRRAETEYLDWMAAVAGA